MYYCAVRSCNLERLSYGAEVETDSSIVITTWWQFMSSNDFTGAGWTFVLSKAITGSCFLKFANRASSLTDSASFSVHDIISTSRDVTVTAGTTCRRSVCNGKAVLRVIFRLLAAVFEFAIWILGEEEWVIVRITAANSDKALAVSELILVHDSWIFLLNSGGACNNNRIRCLNQEFLDSKISIKWNLLGCQSWCRCWELQHGMHIAALAHRSSNIVSMDAETWIDHGMVPI